jgi:hypothetical protein
MQAAGFFSPSFASFFQIELLSLLTFVYNHLVEQSSISPVLYAVHIKG